MKYIYSTLFLVATFACGKAQIGGGWDWAFNTGSLGAPSIKHFSYKANGTIYFGGQAIAAAKFGNTTLTANAVSGFPGTNIFFGKINSSTGEPTIIKSYTSAENFSVDCITTNSNGDFFFAGNITRGTTANFGDGFTQVASINENLAYVAKVNEAGVTQWFKTFNFGASGIVAMQFNRLAVSNQGNIFFVARNLNTPVQSNQLIYPLAKLDSNGNTVWIQEGGAGFLTGSNLYADKFVDAEENIQLIEYTTSRTYTFNGETFTAPQVTVGGAVYSHHLSLNTNGNKRFVNSYRGALNNVFVDRSNNSIYFTATQNQVNTASLANVPLNLGLNPSIPEFYYGIVQTDKDGNMITSSGINGRGGLLNSSTYLPIGGGKLALAQTLANNSNYAVGVDYLYPSESTNYGFAIVETDENWIPVKMISGGKSRSTRFHESDAILAYNGNNYAAAVNFGNTSASPSILPTTTFGSISLTGFNAATNLTTAYGIYSTSSAFRTDLAFVHTNSNNFPVLGTTTWLGNNANWNDASNWTNGVPTNAIKAVFNGTTATLPTTFTSPTTGSLQIAAGTTITLPTTLTLAGGIRNDGTIRINNAGFFQAMGAKSWVGNGTVEFMGTGAVSWFANIPFNNSIILNGSLSTFYDLSIPTITFNTTATKFDLAGKTLTITNAATTAISGTSSTKYIYGGTLKRAINSTGVYMFPLGTSSVAQTAIINANNVSGVGTLAATFTTGAITGTSPNINFAGSTITTALNGGWFSINPNMQPTGGNYDITLHLASSSNTVVNPARYTVIKRNNSTSAWGVNGSFVLPTVNAGIVTATLNGLTSFSDFAIGIGTTVLPVHFVNFVAANSNNQVLLNWQTTTEVNNKGFTIQHSTNGVNFINIGFVAGKGNSLQNNEYRYTHFAPVNGINYYRLQQIDNDGTIAYSKVQSVHYSSSLQTLQSYPNPAINTIQFSKAFSANSSITISAVNGVVIGTNSIQGNSYNIGYLKSGVYFITIIDGTTKEVCKTKFIKM
jgi:Secretion system C-terminal sorting domain